ncbi:MoaD/ThiS family protein [Helicobacter brantae]|uniref:Molybdopterin synthase sulfur carrier subunit n=1 Tax=Helicobacter brantae TaxID=375927 RepID=A0A3D8J1B8_9HELI|nr:MoaD/ThiS family protein [Helicobacter brantae]RDU70965.1 molybdopterin synthase sulfur carrier subunit [Helicobacter brantae]
MAKVKVEFLGPIGLEAKDFEVANLEELRAELQKIEALREWLKLSAVALNDEIVEDLSTPLKDGDKLVLLPPVCGG